MSIWEQLGDMMVAVTFAEADEGETAREIMRSAGLRKVHRRSVDRQRLRQKKYAENVDHVLHISRKKTIGCNGNVQENISGNQRI